MSTTLASEDVVIGVTEERSVSLVDDARKESLPLDMAKKKRSESELKHVSARKQDTADNPCRGDNNLSDIFRGTSPHTAL